MLFIFHIIKWIGRNIISYVFLFLKQTYIYKNTNTQYYTCRSVNTYDILFLKLYITK